MSANLYELKQLLKEELVKILPQLCERLSQKKKDYLQVISDLMWPYVLSENKSAHICQVLKTEVSHWEFKFEIEFV